MSLINYVTKIHFAAEVLEDAIEAEIEHLAIRRPLVITDDLALRRSGIDRLITAMPRGVRAVLHEAAPGLPDEPECEAAATRFRDVEADGLIGFGGPAAINLARWVAAHLAHDGAIHRLTGTDGLAPATTLPPLIAVPTTPASCPEAFGAAILATRQGPHIALAGRHLLPRVVICDPTLTLDLPADRTASAGMDTLTHCLETYIATAYNPPADGIAREGLRRALAMIERAVEHGDDLEARREMMAAALNGALAGQKGLGGVHAMSNALSGVAKRDLDHGAINAILLPHVLAFNAPAVAGRYEAIGAELGLDRTDALPDAMARLRERICLPSALSQLGIDGNEIARASVYAESDHANRTNPRRAGSEDYHAMMRAAFGA